MSKLRQKVEDYLAIRRSLGYKLVGEGALLRAFASFAERSGNSVITTRLAIAWASASPRSSSNTAARRLGTLRRFAEFVRAIDPRTEIPPRNSLPYCHRRPTPYFYSATEIAALMDAAQALRASAFRRSTFSTLIGLLAVTGMRHGEVIALDRADFDAREGIITIREGKFGKSRQVPLHPTTRAVLLAYGRVRDRAIPRPDSPSLFLSVVGKRLVRQHVSLTFHRVLRRAGFFEKRPRPRIHDLRHSFAISTLIDWYRAGVDVEARLPMLSTYLGHVSPSSTYWYLTAVPELVCLAARRLERALGGRP